MAGEEVEAQPINPPPEYDQTAYYERRVGSLDAVRKRSEQWATILGSLTGVFGIVSIFTQPDLRNSKDGWKAGIVVVYFFALIALLGSYYFLIPATLTLNNNNVVGYRAWLANQMVMHSNDEVERVKKSIFLGFFAIALFSIAVGLGWYAPERQ